MFVKPKETRSVFATDISFNGKKASDIKNSASVPTTITKKSQLSNTNTKNRNKIKKNNREAGCNNNNTSQFCIYSHYNRSCLPIPETRFNLCRANQTKKRDDKQNCEPCLAYGNISYFFTGCYLVLSQDKNLIPKKKREIFKSNIKVTSFRKKIDDF